MKSATYYFTLKILSPVHIGCGEVYEPTNFVVDEKSKALVVFDTEDFLEKLSPEELSTFSQHCTKGTTASLLDIYRFMRLKNGIAEGRRVQLSPAFLDHYERTMKLSHGNIDRELNNFKIERTAYQSVVDLPYIPGSAIKGALRNAVLNVRNRGQAAKGNARQLEENLLGGTFHLDPFRLVKVSDFVALPGVGQRVVYAVNRKKKPNDKEARGPYQIMEVVEPGSEFFGSITVNQAEARAGVSKPLSFSDLDHALKTFYGKELAREEGEQKLIANPVAPVSAAADGYAPLRVGRHSGAECLTIEGVRNIKIMLGQRNSSFLDHATTLWFAAPSSNPSAQTALQSFGWTGLKLLADEKAAVHKKELVLGHQKWLGEAQEKLVTLRARVVALAEEKRKADLIAAQKAAEQQRIADELARYPWRPLLEKLAAVTDWGQFKTQVLEQPDFVQYQGIEEVASRVADKAVEIAKANPKKWKEDPQREDAVKVWLQPAGLAWASGLFIEQGRVEIELSSEEQALLDQINGYSDWNQYLQSRMAFDQLTSNTVGALEAKFKSWGCHERSAKRPKRDAWQSLQQRKRNLKR